MLGWVLRKGIGKNVVRPVAKLRPAFKEFEMLEKRKLQLLKKRRKLISQIRKIDAELREIEAYERLLSHYGHLLK